jgi:hypothetical protein
MIAEATDNAIDWMDVFDNADDFIDATSGVEAVSGANVHVMMRGNASSNPAQQLRCKDTVAQPCDANPRSDPISKMIPANDDQASTNTASTTTTTTRAWKKKLTTEEKKQARSEKKRSREKQRRLDVNAQIVELTAVLQKVEAEENESGDAVANTSTPGNRIDLVGQTISALSRLHNDNGKRHAEITELQEMVTVAKKKMKLREEQDLAASAVQTGAMMIPMMNGSMVPLQSMMYPTACVSDPMSAMYNAMVQPKVFNDLNKPPSILKISPNSLPQYSFHDTLQNKEPQPSIENNTTRNNLAHCA